MLNIAVYSNDSLFLAEFTRSLSTELGSYARESCRFRKFTLFQTSLYDGSETPFDLCVLDIRDDPERDLKLVRELKKSAGTEVMVVAFSPALAMAAYDEDVMSYLLYPPDTRRAARIILRRFTQRFEPQEKQFSFRTASGMRVLSAERIVYVEYSDHKLLVYTDLGKKLMTTTMRLSFGEAAAQLLADPCFVRTHASFIVNIMHITEFGQAVLMMDTGVTVPVSHAKRREVKQHFNEFFSRA